MRAQPVLGSSFERRTSGVSASTSYDTLTVAACSRSKACHCGRNRQARTFAATSSDRMPDKTRRVAEEDPRYRR